MSKTYEVYFLLTKDGKLNAWSPIPLPGFVKGELKIEVEEDKEKREPLHRGGTDVH